MLSITLASSKSSLNAHRNHDYLLQKIFIEQDPFISLQDPSPRATPVSFYGLLIIMYKKKWYSMIS